MPGPHLVLDDRRPRDEAPRFPTLLQRLPHACWAGWTHARRKLQPGPRMCERQFVSLAGALSGAVSNTDSRVTDAAGWPSPLDPALYSTCAGFPMRTV